MAARVIPFPMQYIRRHFAKAAELSDKLLKPCPCWQIVMAKIENIECKHLIEIYGILYTDSDDSKIVECLHSGEFYEIGTDWKLKKCYVLDESSYL